MASFRHLQSSLRRYVSVSPFAAKSSKVSSRLVGTPLGPDDPILGITIMYNSDSNPQKINLGVGAYRDEGGLPFVLSAVREAERRILDRNLAMEYLPVAGDSAFVQKAIRLAYGENDYIKNGCVSAMQALSGTGACRMAGEFLARYLDYGAPGRSSKPLILLPDPSWTNHSNIFRDAGCQVGSYSYYHPPTKGLDFEACIKSLTEAPEGSVVLLHACAHNPTGVDPSSEQWAEISSVLKSKHHLPLFDMAYQGFTSGDADVDAASVRQFVSDGHRVILAQSFSKNFGLYGHRVGCLSVLTDSKEEATAISSQLKIIARPMYSNPPISGVRIVNEVLGDSELETSWRAEMKGMADRITSVRTLLRNNLTKLGSALNWDHIVDQNGMFCYSGLTKEHVEQLRNEHSIYLTLNGRISMAGVTKNNVERLAHAIHQVTK